MLTFIPVKTDLNKLQRILNGNMITNKVYWLSDCNIDTTYFIVENKYNLYGLIDFSLYRDSISTKQKKIKYTVFLNMIEIFQGYRNKNVASYVINELFKLKEPYDNMHIDEIVGETSNDIKMFWEKLGAEFDTMHTQQDLGYCSFILQRSQFKDYWKGRRKHV